MLITVALAFSLLQLISACGIRYVPPMDSTDIINNRQSCVPCKRNEPAVGLSESLSPRLFWDLLGGDTTTTTTTTTAPLPCCPTGNTLTNATACGQATVRIVGGEEATENQLPWQCMIQKSDGGFYGCGATIISCDPVIIVSAAHCFQGADSTPNGIKVSCGDWKIDTTDTNEQSLTVTQIINHPNYVASTYANDIAVLKVSGSFTCAQGKIWPACLPNKSKLTYEGWQDTIASGWGTTSSGGSLSNTLRYVKVPIVADATCNAADSYAGQIISDQMVCAGFAAGGKDACQGDSGGPLVTKATGVDAGYALAGVVSFGQGCAAAKFYGVYAEFANYLEWVATQYGLTV